MSHVCQTHHTYQTRDTYQERKSSESCRTYQRGWSGGRWECRMETLRATPHGCRTTTTAEFGFIRTRGISNVAVQP